jgi:hypothetical protein
VINIVYRYRYNQNNRRLSTSIQNTRLCVDISDRNDVLRKPTRYCGSLGSSIDIGSFCFVVFFLAAFGFRNLPALL